MRNRKTIGITLSTIVLAGVFIAFGSAASTGKQKAPKESMDQCCKKKNAIPSKATWENLSRQFFSSI